MSLSFFAAAFILGGNGEEPSCVPERLVFDGAVEVVEHASSCPEVFGDEADYRRNQSRREDHLEDVDPDGYFITHDSDWIEPIPIEPLDLHLVATETQGDCAPYAIVDLRPGEETIDCEPGLYAVEVDASLGRDARVLAIFDDILLIENRGDLQYVMTDLAVEPQWRMVWHPPWKFTRPPAPPVPAARSKRQGRGRRN